MNKAQLRDLLRPTDAEIETLDDWLAMIADDCNDNDIDIASMYPTNVEKEICAAIERTKERLTAVKSFVREIKVDRERPYTVSWKKLMMFHLAEAVDALCEFTDCVVNVTDVE